MLALTQPTCTPSAYWQGELQRLFGEPNDHLAWLHLHFHPTWERWVIYQVVPPKATTGFILRERGEGEPLLNVERDLMDEGQLQVYDETGCYASAFWIIQGLRGGHRRRLWPYERTMAEMAGLPGETPHPGDLEYAEMDSRVVHELHRLDQVGKWNKMLEYCDRNSQFLDLEEQEAQREVRKQLWKWVQGQVGNVFEGMMRRDITAALDELPHGLGKDAAKPVDYDEWLERKFMPPGTILT